MKWGAGHQTTQVDDKYLRAARALRACKEPSAKQLMTARHMAHEGATSLEVGEFLGWGEATSQTIRDRLKKFNIKCQPAHQRRAHLGNQTSLTCCSNGTDQRSFRPRELGGA